MNRLFRQNHHETEAHEEAETFIDYTILDPITDPEVRRAFDLDAKDRAVEAAKSAKNTQTNARPDSQIGNRMAWHLTGILAASAAVSIGLMPASTETPPKQGEIQVAPNPAPNQLPVGADLTAENLFLNQPQS